MTRAVLPVHSGPEAWRRCWWLVRPRAGLIAERAWDAGALATAVAPWLARMLLAHPTLATAQFAYRAGLGSLIKTARLRSGMQTGRWLADHRPRSTEGEGRSTGKL